MVSLLVFNEGEIAVFWQGGSVPPEKKAVTDFVYTRVQKEEEEDNSLLLDANVT